jgi:hypothetical protein
MRLDRINYALSKSYSDKTFIAKAGTAPAAGLRSVLGIDNGETSFSSKALFDATAPSTQAYSDAAAVGSAMSAARRDHKHAMPSITTVTDTLLDYTPVAGSGAGSDTFACDVGSAKIKRFSLTIADTDAKVITFSNVPAGRCEVELEITTSAVGSVTWTLNSGSSLAWVNGAAPTLASGKVYLIQFRTSDNGATWDAAASWGV